MTHLGNGPSGFELNATGSVAPLGLVYELAFDGGDLSSACAARTIVRLRNLLPAKQDARRLSGRFVVVRNDGMLNQPDPISGVPLPTPLGDALPNREGHFLFDPGRGGGRVDRLPLADEGFRARYAQAAHFGEVNVYHHIDRMAVYVSDLLHELGASDLPRVTAVVNAHHAAIADADGDRDGVHRVDGRVVPFQGGHYRLPGRAVIVRERHPIAPAGEIHLGPGQQLSRHGALSRSVGGPYRANASHNPGVIYHEYAHHITRHTADFRANSQRPVDRQSNRKTALDEGMADYWAAALLGTPHIWIFHHRHDGETLHPRSLLGGATMQTFTRGPAADPHSTGTVWASALWDMRCRSGKILAEGARAVDRLVLQALLLIGERTERPMKGSISESREQSPTLISRARRGLGAASRDLLQADRILHNSRLRDVIVTALRQREIDPEGSHELRTDGSARVLMS